MYQINGGRTMQRSILVLAIFFTITSFCPVGLADLSSNGMLYAVRNNQILEINPTDWSWIETAYQGTNIGSLAYIPDPVPVPSAFLLGGLGLAVAGRKLRRRRTA